MFILIAVVNGYTLHINMPNTSVNIDAVLLSEVSLYGDLGPCIPIYCNCTCAAIEPVPSCWFAIMSSNNCPFNTSALLTIVPDGRAYDTDLLIFYAFVTPFMYNATEMKLLIPMNMSSFERYIAVICALAGCTLICYIAIYKYSDRSQQSRRSPTETTRLVTTEHKYNTLEHHNNETHETCLICITGYTENENLKELPCMHRYHALCIDTWLVEGHTCPVCRRGGTTSPPTPPLLHRIL